jgi:hypothetical protein
MLRSRSRSRFAVAASITLTAACDVGDSGSTSEDGAQTSEVTLGPYEVVVPLASPIDGLATQPANNNLDVASHVGRTFLAWRTAPTHFASTETELLVASEGDDGFRFEGRFAMGTDLREPRLLAMNGELFLYFAELGADFSKFEPVGTWVARYVGPGEWTEPARIYEPGFIPWRTKVVDGTPYIVGYTGGANIYEFDGEPLRVHFLTTSDGFDFRPAVIGRPVVLEGGGSETDFTFLPDGTLVAVTRNEAGEEGFGFGSKICRARPGSLADWECAADRRKYDSPLVFAHEGQAWLVARRQVTETGHFDLGKRELSLEEQAKEYAVAYSFTPKRCSLWKLDAETLSASFVVDLPSRGDTCFAAQLPLADGSGVTIYNYTNALDGAPDCAQWPERCDDPTWFGGQGMPTVIVRLDAVFAPR